MLQSMTGFGKAECVCGNNKIIIEIKSVNGKSSDISLKTQIIPREKEIEIKQYLQSILHRGNIDLYTTVETLEENYLKTLNQDMISHYVKQILTTASNNSMEVSNDTVLSNALRLPEVLDSSSAREKTTKEVDENWNSIKDTIEKAVATLVDYRKTEGARLQEDLANRISLIGSYLCEIENMDSERNSMIKEKLKAKIEESVENPDMNRFEQEIIYYLEKLDITEEKVRLKQHCDFFLESVNREKFAGKKLGFISQEIGREINTIGSKANHAGIQKMVVQMKEELEKIKEQTLNIL